MEIDLCRGGAANENYQRQQNIANLFPNSTLKLKIGILIELFANNFCISFELLLLLIERTSSIYISLSLSLYLSLSLPYLARFKGSCNFA